MAKKMMRDKQFKTYLSNYLQPLFFVLVVFDLP